jgi:hypothetical protein
MDGSKGNSPTCHGCGAVLTLNEVEYYIDSCEKCEQQWLYELHQAMGGQHCCLVCFPDNTEVKP